MSDSGYKEGWGVIDADGLNVNTVSETRRAAVVNWLVVVARTMILDSYSDERIDTIWDAKRGEALVCPVRIYVVA